MLTALAYIAAGLAALRLTVPTGYAAPLYPAAGIALASVLVYGPRMLIGVAFGSFVVSASLIDLRSHFELMSLVVPLAVGAGAALQTWLGARLIERVVSRPLTLTGPGDVAKFFGACTLASVVNASVSTAALAATATVPRDQLLFTWATWWAGDLAGLLIATPIALTLIGRPRSEWASRRLSVGLTLSLVTAFLALAIVQVGRWSGQRLQSVFDQDAASASLVLTTRLQEPLRALEALHGVFNVTTDVGPPAMDLATRSWLRSDALDAMGWLERVSDADRAAFEARLRASGSPDYRVFDRGAAGTLFSPAPAGDPTAVPTARLPDGDLLPVRLVEPARARAGMLGVNALSVAAVRTAVESALNSGLPAASVGFARAASSTSAASAASPGRGGSVVVTQAVYGGNPTSEVDRRAALRGVAFVSVSMDALLDSVAGQLPAYLHLCIVDVQAGALPQRLAGRAGCETERTAMLSVRTLSFAGRSWSLRVAANPQDLPDAFDRSAWAVALVGLLSASLLGASLLTVTGRASRIETAVSERTAALVSEVAERKVAEAALRDSEQRFRNILDNVPIGVVYSDLPGRVIQANPRFCELTGYSEHELLALSPLDYTHPDDVSEDVELTGQLVRGEIPTYSRHKRYLSKDGRVVWVRSTVSLLRDSQAQPWRIVGVVEDITEHLRLQDAENAREAAEASNRAKSDFLSRMSHELRTPLNAMLGFAQLLELDQRTPLAPAQKPWVAQIQSAGWHLLEMINDVLDLSRIESGNLRLQTSTLELDELVASTVAMVESEASRRRIAITQEFGPGTGELEGDATRVKQILTNLLSNAVKYNSDPGHIHIASRLVGGDTVEVCISDSGLGMTAEQMGELFKPFNRLGRERTALQGTGIGLVISQRLAELMGGSIRAASAPGKGSSFILSLPKATHPNTERQELDALDALPAGYHRRTVHYIEDNETNVEVMRGILAQRPQVDMSVSVTGLDGLAAVRARSPDLILLDMHLPDINGLELLKHLRADPLSTTIPIVIVSADALTEQISDAIAAGAARYLTKPVNVAELLGVVDELLGAMESGFR